MSQVEGERAPFSLRRQIVRLRRAGLLALILLLVVAVLVAAVWLNRRAAAQRVLTGWLEQRGIDADVQVERVEIDGFVGKIVIGDPRDPDFSVQRVEVDYAVGLPWSEGGLGVTPNRIRLLRPILKATWTDGRFSIGSLDPLIEEFTGRPPQPDSRGPIVVVERGRLRLSTEYGPLQVLADATVDDGKLMRLQARMPEASLRSGDVEARGLGGTLSLVTTGDRVALRIDATAERFDTPGISGTDTILSARGNLPYPDLKTRRGDGRAVLGVTLESGQLNVGEALALRTSRAVLNFDGTTAGWIEDFRITGKTSANVRSDAVNGSSITARTANIVIDNGDLTLSRQGEGLDWRIDTPLRVQARNAALAGFTFVDVSARTASLRAGGRGGAVEATGPLALAAGQVALGELVLKQARGQVDLDVTSRDGATLTQATGTLNSSGGAWPLFGPVGPEDLPELAEMKRALGDFAVSAPSFRLTTGSPGTQVVLLRPATLRPTNGGVLTLTPVARPIFEAEPGALGGGALNATATRGAGLPEAAFAIPDWRLTPGGFEARLDGRAALDFGLGRGLTLATEGLLANDAGRLTYQTRSCIPFTAERLELDENDATALSGRFCPPTGPLVVVREGEWSAQGTLADVAGTAEFLAVQFDQGQGTASVVGSPAGIGLDAVITSARVRDTTAPLRFNPLTASGSASLKDERWTGGFDLTRGLWPIAKLTLNHDGTTQSGGVLIETGTLTFAEGGLQPADLSPLVAGFIAPPVTGTATFTGRFDWDAVGGSSAGRLTTPGLDFVSPAGPVKGLRGTIDFTSLEPLTTAPNQTLHADSLTTITELTDLDLTFGLDAGAITVSGGDIAVGGGTVSVEPFSVPLDRTQPFSGVIVLDRVQLGDLLAGAGFGEKVMLDAVVSGRLPFTSHPTEGVRITGGTLYAVQPGRLSIDRTALTDIDAGQATAGGTEVAPNTVQDLAYQAMEDLAFDVLSADVNSLDQGRIGVLFRIKGRHDPPQRQELRLTIAELISRTFLQRELPLPSDTGIDLTLDTTLNANQLVSDLMALNRARNGTPEPTPAPAPAPAPAAVSGTTPSTIPVG